MARVEDAQARAAAVADAEPLVGVRRRHRHVEGGTHGAGPGHVEGGDLEAVDRVGRQHGVEGEIGDAERSDEEYEGAGGAAEAPAAATAEATSAGELLLGWHCESGRDCGGGLF